MQQQQLGCFSLVTGSVEGQQAFRQQHCESPRNDAKQKGFLVPSGHTHSTWGKEAKVVVDCVSHTTMRKANLRRCFRMQSAYHGSSS